MTTQPELPQVALPPARPALRLATAPAESDLDFDAFVRSYGARLRRLVLRRIGDLCEADEITQETLLRAYQHRASFVSEDELMAWSTVVAQRLVIDRVRVRGRSVAVASVPENARLGRDTADIVVARHEARAALESLEAIPTRQAAILWAREVEGLHYEEIAERFGITEPAVRSLLHRGRKALRKEFKDRTGSLPLNGLVPFAPWLLALKAAGKVRGAARTVAKSSGGAAIALSITALVAGGIAGLGHFGTPRPVAIATTRGGATHITALADPVASARAMSSPRRWAYVPAAVPAAAPAPARHGHGPAARACVQSTTSSLCVRKDTVPYSDTTIEILTDNPVYPGGLAVTTDYVKCSDTHLPDSGPVRCTQHDHRDDGAGVPQPASLPQPTDQGALR